MLVELVVENLAVVEQVRVRFHPGLNLLTGETGSGKSLVVDALALLFGGRASAEMVRTGAERAHVAGIFEVNPTPEWNQILACVCIFLENLEILLASERQDSDMSLAFVANQPIST